ncbi:DUF3443 family protein [Ralstonia sp. 1138]|uniref:DUF3443 family protein n=1 Tax=Ralstonia sp. 1138 TaxID=3156423 RepID=UPI003399D404
MKRAIILLLIAVTLGGCGGANDSNDPNATADDGSGSSSSSPTISDNGPGPNYSYAPVSGNNVVPLYFEPTESEDYGWNTPYVTVQLCVPGTQQCVTVDHVLVDTGSTGFRVMKSALNGLNLPLATDPVDGSSISECFAYATSEVWGRVGQADLHVGGESAANMALQVIDDTPGSDANVPSDCKNQGVLTDTVSEFGGKAIIGVHQQFSDGGSYYRCSTGICMPTQSSPVTVKNSVAAFAADNNGVSLQVAPVPDLGTPAAVGQMIFGINTTSNNQIAGLTVLSTDANGYINVSDGTQTIPGFIDSGTAYYIYPNKRKVQTCPDNSTWFCPSSPTDIDITLTGAIGPQRLSTSYRLTNYDAFAAETGIEVVPVGAPGSVFGDGSAWYALGLPFYGGRRIYGSIQNSDNDPMYYAM